MAYVNNFQVNLIENSKKPSIKEIPQVTVNIIADIGFLIALSYFVGAGAFTTINSNVSSFKFLTFIFVFTGIFNKVPLEYL
jgi:hypothetical protein